MRKFVSAIAFLAAVLWVVPVSATSQDPDLFPKEKAFLDNSQKTFQQGVKSGSALNMVALGQNGLGGRGFNADVFFYKSTAYVGRWGFFDPQHPEFCPSEGVAVIDVHDPANPAVVSALPKPALTSAEDIVVYTERFGPFAGHDIAVSGIQACGNRYDPIFRGLALYDVTDAAHPVQVGSLDIGCCTRGVHELDIQDRADLHSTFIYGSVPNSEFPDPNTTSGVRDAKKHGDARLFDVTNPAHPVEVSSWGIKKDLGMDPTVGQGCFARSFGHGMTPSADGKLVFVSYWDAGYIALDVTNPARPVFKGKTTYAADEDGDGHSASYDNARKLLFTADEDFCKTGPGIVKGWGYLRVFDYSNLAHPVQVGAFHTADSFGPADAGAGDFVIHNPLFSGHFVYASWYSDGVRVIDVSDPTNPREVAFFIPPAGQQPIKPPSRAVLPNTAQDWGVAIDEATGLIYISDMNSGLWILKQT
jgi:hypothetical protein